MYKELYEDQGYDTVDYCTVPIWTPRFDMSCNLTKRKKANWEEINSNAKRTCDFVNIRLNTSWYVVGETRHAEHSVRPWRPLVSFLFWISVQGYTRLTSHGRLKVSTAKYETCALLLNYAAYSRNSLPTLRNNLQIPSRMVKNPKRSLAAST